MPDLIRAALQIVWQGMICFWLGPFAFLCWLEQVQPFLEVTRRFG